MILRFNGNEKKKKKKKVFFLTSLTNTVYKQTPVWSKQRNIKLMRKTNIILMEDSQNKRTLCV